MSRYSSLKNWKREAENGLSAQRMLGSRASTRIIDLRMPGMNGLELIQWIRSEGLRMPIIMISAHGDQRCCHCPQEGAQDYIVSRSLRSWFFA